MKKSQKREIHLMTVMNSFKMELQYLVIVTIFLPVLLQHQ